MLDRHFPCQFSYVGRISNFETQYHVVGSRYNELSITFLPYRTPTPWLVEFTSIHHVIIRFSAGCGSQWWTLAPALQPTQTSLRTHANCSPMFTRTALFAWASSRFSEPSTVTDFIFHCSRSKSRSVKNTAELNIAWTDIFGSKNQALWDASQRGEADNGWQMQCWLGYYRSKPPLHDGESFPVSGNHDPLENYLMSSQEDFARSYVSFHLAKTICLNAMACCGLLQRV